MASQWYVARDKKKSGPFSSDQLNQLASAGRLLPTDRVWKEGMTSWVLASKVSGLFASVSISDDPTTTPVQPSPVSASRPATAGPSFLQRAKARADDLAAKAKAGAGDLAARAKAAAQQVNAATPPPVVAEAAGNEMPTDPAEKPKGAFGPLFGGNPAEAGLSKPQPATKVNGLFSRRSHHRHCLVQPCRRRARIVRLRHPTISPRQALNADRTIWLSRRRS